MTNKQYTASRVFAIVVALAGNAATPILTYAATVGTVAPNAEVEDADANKLAIGDLRGSPVIVFYEDRDSGELNRALKSELASLMREDGMSSIRTIPVADVSDYDSWPSKGFVRKAIRKESKKAGLTIYCDWDASFRKKLELERGTSNVIVIGRDGNVKFADAGALGETARGQILSILRAEAAKK